MPTAAVPVDALQQFVETYAPKAVISEHPRTLEELVPRAELDAAAAARTPITSSDYAFTMRSNYAGMGRVGKLFADALTNDTRLRYDWVIRARTDSVLVRYPDLSLLPSGYIYAPDWPFREHRPLITNHVIIIAPALASQVMSAAESVDHITATHGVAVIDELMFHGHLEHSGLLKYTRLIAISHFEPTLTRDGVTSVLAYESESPELPHVTLPLSNGEYPFRDSFAPMNPHLNSTNSSATTLSE